MKGPPPGIEEIIYSRSRDVTNCPSCGRYVGPLQICPYCRAIHRKRPIVTFLKYSTPLLGALGLVLLYHLGQTMGNPLVKLRQLDLRSNFAYIRLEGTVCDEPRFYPSKAAGDPTSGSLEFCLDDGTGRTTVKSFEDATRRIIRARKLPSKGDHVRVVGNYQIRANRSHLVVSSPDELEIDKGPVDREMTAEELVWAPKRALNGIRRVTVTGEVRHVWNDRKKGFNAVMHLSGGWKKDRHGKRRYLQVPIKWERLELEGVIPKGADTWAGMPAPGTIVRVTGNLVWSERGKDRGWRVYPTWAADIEVLDDKGKK